MACYTNVNEILSYIRSMSGLIAMDPTLDALPEGKRGLEKASLTSVTGRIPSGSYAEVLNSLILDYFVNNLRWNYPDITVRLPVFAGHRSMLPHKFFELKSQSLRPSQRLTAQTVKTITPKSSPSRHQVSRRNRELDLLHQHECVSFVNIF